jgi:hypothetical protein
MLDHHPDLAVANDSHFIPLAVRDVPVGVDPPLTAELVEWVRTYRRFHRLGLTDQQVDEAAGCASTYAGFVGALYATYARVRGKRWGGEKTPDYVKRLPRLHGLFPHARNIHIIRDGRDVALSAREWATEGKGPGKLALWDDEPVAVCALWWSSMVALGRRDGAALGGGAYREVGYERLVADPESELAALAAFLGLPDSTAMASFHEGRTRPAPGRSAKNAWLPPTPGLRSWQSAMPPRELNLFEALAGDLLAELGYELSGVPPSAEVARVARAAREWWDSGVGHRWSGKASSSTSGASAAKR